MPQFWIYPKEAATPIGAKFVLFAIHREVRVSERVTVTPMKYMTVHGVVVWDHNSLYIWH